MSLLNLFPKAEKGPVLPQRKARVLIAEDDKYLNDFYVELLTDEGYEMLSAFNGKEALDIIMQTPPDLVILDINMPMMNGQEVLMEMRKNEQTKNLPVIMLTNAGTLENMTEARVDHANKFFIKTNIEPPVLIKAIKDLLSPDAVMWFKEDAGKQS